MAAQQGTIKSGFRLAMAQMRVEPGRKERNIARAIERIDQAARAGANVVVLPEAITTGWTHPCSIEQAETIPSGNFCALLSQIALRHGIFVCAGLLERVGEKVYNSAVLINPLGGLLIHHRKINELEIAQECYALGDRLQVAATSLATFGLMICADAFAEGQVLSRALGLMGADVILSPCAWAVPADHDNTREPYGQLWRDNYGPVARQFRLWIAGASNVGPIEKGPWAGRKCIGCSLLVGPGGQQVLMGPYGADAEVILYADIIPAPRPASGDGWARLWAAQAGARVS